MASGAAADFQNVLAFCIQGKVSVERGNTEDLGFAKDEVVCRGSLVFSCLVFRGSAASAASSSASLSV